MSVRALSKGYDGRACGREMEWDGACDAYGLQSMHVCGDCVHSK